MFERTHLGSLDQRPRRLRFPVHFEVLDTLTKARLPNSQRSVLEGLNPCPEFSGRNDKVRSCVLVPEEGAEGPME